MFTFNTGLNTGYYSFNKITIDLYVPKNSKGVYVLGQLVSDSNTLFIYYVGSSYTCLNRRLKEHLKEHEEYEYFGFGICNNDLEIFLKEYYIYDKIRFGGHIYNREPPKPRYPLL